MPVRLSSKVHYLQLAMNSTLYEARRILSLLPVSERILIEAGTPLIKEYGAGGIADLWGSWRRRLMFSGASDPNPYVVADLKAMDRGVREVDIAVRGRASAAVVLGMAPAETLDVFVEACESRGIDAMVDMMNVQQPYQVLRKMKKLPKVVILHRGVDEEDYSDKPVPIHMINKIKGAFDVMVSVAGGDTNREVQSAVFNGADIVVLWRYFYQLSDNTVEMAREFLRQVK